jgi:hypothetical protein
MFESFKMRTRLKDVEEGLEQMQRQFKRQEIEWIDTLDKLRTMMGRIVKDRERAERARAEVEPSPSEAPSEEVQPNSMSPRQNAINERILARRRHLT